MRNETTTRGQRALATLAAATMAIVAVGGFWACGSDGRPRPAAPAEAKALSLDTLPFAELTLPPDNRPDHAEPPVEIPLQGPWRYVGSTRKDMHKYATEIPIRPRGLFFHRPQPGIRLTTADGTEVKYDRFGRSDTFMWAHDRRELIVYYPEASGPPEPGQFVLSYPKATARERALNLRWSNHAEDPAAFAWTTIQDDWDNRRGLLLSAPGVAAWDVDVPPAAELAFDLGIVAPETKVGTPSDGARLTGEIEVNGEVSSVFELEVPSQGASWGDHPGDADGNPPQGFTPHRIDLSKWAGQHVRLRLKSDPGPAGDATYDYLFVAEPMITSRKANPVRVVMIFVDTLRPDHLGMYGYERDTTASIDPFAKQAALFTNAHTVAPWTLPSARSIVTGRHPEFYDDATTVQQVLHDKGWATAFIAGNVYLSENFGMHRDWDFHRVGLWPLAEETTNDALRWLEEHDGRDALLQVHFMSTHLPYVEPPSYRRKYAGDAAGGLREEFHLSDVRKARVEDDPDAQQYIKDRYDNNVRYVTDQIRRILDTLDDNDVVLFYADHGEEFWDHQGFEHGHTLYEELLHVPLVIDAPGVKGAKIDTRVSLLDLTPTILDLVGVEAPPDLDGRSLVPLLRGEQGAAAPFDARDLAFGRPLYGTERWGVLHGLEKWTTHEGKESLHDLATDPKEKKNVLGAGDAGAPYRKYLADALGREVGVGYRLMPTNHRGGGPVPGLWTLCTVPGGFADAWKADDPLENSSVTVRTIADANEAKALLAQYGITDHAVGAEDGAVEFCWNAGWFGSREVYAVPERPLADVGHQMVCSAYLGDHSGGKQGTMRIDPERDATAAGARSPQLARLALDQRQLTWMFGVAPIPDERTLALSGRDDETNEMLEAMGYVDPEKPDGGSKPDKGDKAKALSPGDGSDGSDGGGGDGDGEGGGDEDGGRGDEHGGGAGGCEPPAQPAKGAGKP